MSDRFPAQICIGGQLSRTKRLYPDDKVDDGTVLNGLIAVLGMDYASHEYGDAPISYPCTEAELLETYLDDGFLVFKNDQAVNGEFQETEQFCMDHDIPFDRCSDHYCEYDAENVHWRPGMNSPMIRYADSHGSEIVDGATVREALSKLTSFSYDHRTALVTEAEKLLQAACPELPPEFEKFEIVA